MLLYVDRIIVDHRYFFTKRIFLFLSWKLINNWWQNLAVGLKEGGDRPALGMTEPVSSTSQVESREPASTTSKVDTPDSRQGKYITASSTFQVDRKFSFNFWLPPDREFKTSFLHGSGYCSIRDPGSGAFWFTASGHPEYDFFGSRISDPRSWIPVPGSQTHNF
jgi:hypothetical protein